jgi:hypothetical protein
MAPGESNAAGEGNGRTHEPSLRELTADLDGVRAVFDEKVDRVREVADERDRRYEERFRAMDEKTSLALTASEKAVTKAETATEKRFDAVNEFRGTLSDQAANLLPRGEANARFDAYDGKVEEIKKEIAILRDTGSRSEGGIAGVKGSWIVVTVVIGLIIAFLEVLALIRK